MFLFPFLVAVSVQKSKRAVSVFSLPRTLFLSFTQNEVFRHFVHVGRSCSPALSATADLILRRRGAADGRCPRHTLKGSRLRRPRHRGRGSAVQEEPPSTPRSPCPPGTGQAWAVRPLSRDQASSPRDPASDKL